MKIHLKYEKYSMLRMLFINFTLFDSHLQFNIGNWHLPSIYIVNWFILQASSFDYDGSSDDSTGCNRVKYVLIDVIILNTMSKFYNYIISFS